MTSGSTKLSPAWVLTVVTADSFLLFPNNMFHSLNSIVIGNRAIPSYSAEMLAIRSIHGFTFVFTCRGFDEILLGDFSLATPKPEAVPTAETGDPRFPCNETELRYFGRVLIPSSPVWFNSKPPSEHGGENPVVPVVAKMRLLFLSRASINVKLEILTRRGICCFILPQG